MAIHRASDSLSRCDPNAYSNIYDVRKRSDIKHDPIGSSQSIKKDTLEISRDQIKKEALNRLRHTTKIVVPQSSFMRIGKYIFLSIAFPPYLLVYGLPKWFIVEFGALSISLTVWMWKKVKEKTKTPRDIAVGKISQAVHYIKQTVSNLIQPVIRLVLEIRHGIERMRKNVYQFFQRLPKGVKDRVKGAINFPRLKAAEIFKRMQNKMSRVKEKSFQKIQGVSIRFQEGVQWVKQSPQLMLEWGQLRFQQWIHRAASRNRPLTNRFRSSQQLALQATNWIFKQIHDGRESIKRNLKPLAAFYRQQLMPHWHQFKRICQTKWRQMRDFMQQKHQKVAAFLHQKQEKLKKLSFQQFNDRLFSHPLMNYLPEWIRRWLKKLLSHRIAQRLYEQGIKVYSFVLTALLKASSVFMKRVFTGSGLIHKTWSRFLPYVRKGRQIGLHVLNLGWRMSHKFFRQGIYYFLLFSTMGGILFIWGLGLLGELMKGLKTRFSFKN